MKQNKYYNPTIKYAFYYNKCALALKYAYAYAHHSKKSIETLIHIGNN